MAQPRRQIARKRYGSDAGAPGSAPPDAVLFEVSSEVCNQVGGIYQVLRSKAALIANRWPNRYWLVGPYVEHKASVEFEPSRPPRWLGRAIDALAAQGVTIHHGRWLIAGNPRVLLIQRDLPWQEIDKLKFELWSEHGIESPGGDRLVDESIAFADGVRRLLAAVCESLSATPSAAANASSATDGPDHGAADDEPAGRRVVAHFHEWLGGLAIPLVRKAKLPVATVFTTHATILGRYMASSEDGFYDRLWSIDNAAEAAKYNIKGIHGYERACAHGAHVFTTVSPITGEECGALLGRVPDLFTPNGLNIGLNNVGHEFQTLHAKYKDQIHRFVMGYFFPSYAFDLDRTVYMFTSGRFEPRNKGFDLCLEALARLNAQIKEFDLGVNVVFFIVTQRQTKNLDPETLRLRAVLNELDNVCDSIVQSVGHKMFPLAASGQRAGLDALVDPYWSLRYRRTQQAFKRSGLPPVVSHHLENDWADPVLNHIRNLGLCNRPDDPVKIVYHPEFISPTSPLWGMDYDHFVRGTHLGVFPSAYEPWGYTPLECMAAGTPAITSDLAGFGGYVAERHPDHDTWGMTVLKRRSRSFHDAAADLARWMLAFCRLDRRGRIAMRNAVESKSWDFDWARLGTAYHRAHDLALERIAREAESNR